MAACGSGDEVRAAPWRWTWRLVGAGAGGGWRSGQEADEVPYGRLAGSREGLGRAELARRRRLQELDGAVEPQVRSETRQAPDPGRRGSFPTTMELRATMADLGFFLEQ